MQGDSSHADKPTARTLGTGSYGLLTVSPPGDNTKIYGVGICAGSYYTDSYPVLPYAGAGQTPTTLPPINGGLELDLMASVWSGTTYSFYSANLVFGILVVPAF